MHYANETQLSALKELGFTPTEDKTTLTEVAQWLWEKHKIELATDAVKSGNIDVKMNIVEGGDWEIFEEYTFPTIPEALSWAIDQAIKYLQEQK